MKDDTSPSSYFLMSKFVILGSVVVVYLASIATSFEVSSPPGGRNTIISTSRYGGSLSGESSSSTRSSISNRRRTGSERQQQTSYVSPLQSRVSFLEQYQQYQENNHSSLSCSGRITSACLIFPRPSSSHRSNTAYLKNRWSYPPLSSSSLSSTSSSSSSLSSTPQDLGSENIDEEPQQEDLGDDNKEEESSSTNNVGYDDLYEFLTRRTGHQAGESERRRKRDRIMEWMPTGTAAGGGSGGESGNAASSLIQPIRLEDGKVDEELIAKQQQEEAEQQNTSSRTKIKFDELFSGMPSLNDIISGGDNVDGDGNGDAADIISKKKKSRMTDDDDFSWFEPERLRIESEYDQIRQETRERIREQRLLEKESEENGSSSSDIDNIPNNAEGIADAIVQQEMNQMIASVKLERSKERLQEYELNRSSDIQSQDYRGATDDVVNKILKETAEQQERNDKLKARVDEYEEYEQRLRQQQQEQQILYGSDDDSNKQKIMPGEDTDMDDWTLERLEEMLLNSQNREDDDGTISDILEENIENLRKQIEQESKKGSIEPQTMKEWQMYRSIFTRLQNGDGTMENGEDDDSNNIGGVDEAQVAQQLNSWREYIVKEDGMRQRSGLSSGPKLPFDHLGTKTDQMPTNEDADEENENKSRRELNREVNIQAVQVMEDLIQKSDSRRSESLRKQLEILKADLESRDYNDIEEEIIEEPVSFEPVDLSGVFNRKKEENKKDKKQVTFGFSKEEIDSINQVFSDPGTSELYSPPPTKYEDPVERDPPPNTPFFSDSSENENQSPAPNTPFFQEKTNKSDVEELDIQNKLGSVDEQKLQAMFRRANVRTIAEQDSIRQEWEAFQAFEKESRGKSGLSESTDDSTVTDDVQLKYDINDVMTSDGDFDAAKILSTIGPRPVRKKAQGSATASDTTDLESDENTIDDALRSDVDPSEVADAIYRSVAAAGGGRGKEDEELKEKDRAEYEDYLAKEKEMRRNLDQREEEISDAAITEDIDIDDPGYAEEALGPRPVVKRMKREVLDERELSDRGGIRATDDDEDEEEEEDDGTDDAIDDSAFDDLVPGWLKKEREAVAKSREEGSDGFLGSDIDEVFDDDKYDQNLRQLHEYEQRRSGGKQMGIDVTDVFGQRGSDDYGDYTHDTDYLREREDDEWGERSLKARKTNLLQYIELDPAEVNNLIAYKDSSSVSQYLPRVNKPFKEFGAIFRLEGVLVDITGLQQKVWNRVAIEFDFKEPLMEDIKRVAVLGPESAVRDLFHSTIGDFVFVRRIIDAYRRVLREEFDIWAIEQGIDVIVEPSISDNADTTSGKGSLAMGFVEEPLVKQEPQPTVLPFDEGKRLRQLKEVWSKTAKQFGFAPPTNEEIAESSILSPDIAVCSIFCWSEDQIQIGKIVSAFSIVQGGGGVTVIEEDPNHPSPNISTTGSEPVDEPPIELTEEIVLELQYMAWEEVAEENSFEAPDPEEVLAAAVLNNPGVVVMDGFGWTEDPSRATELASRYRERLTKLVNDLIHKRSYTPIATKLVETEATSVIDTATVNPMMPTEDEILSSQIEAWAETAREHDFDAPTSEQIQLMMNINPQDAVRQLIIIDFDIDELTFEEATEFELTMEEITETYISALERSSKKYLKKYKISSGSQVSSDSDGDTTSNSNDVSQDEIYSAAFDAWTSVAWKLGFPLPDEQEIQFALTVGPFEAIIGGFCWTEDEEEAKDIAQQYLNQIKLRRDIWLEKGYITTMELASNNPEQDSIPLVKVMPDVSDWIQSLRAVEMGCGVVTHLEDDQMKILLEFVGLSELIPSDNRVSHSNGYLRESQQLLGISLRIERRPDQCIVFDTSPFTSVAAREFDMRSVALIGPYPRYELMTADTTATSVDELTAMNIRRLFGENVYDQPELETMEDRVAETTRPVKTKYEWAGDE
jgi:beta-phosphoglucomutase-like phosphatase (HAD superfamily)